MELLSTKIGGHDCEGVAIEISIPLGKKPPNESDLQREKDELIQQILDQLRITIRKQIIDTAFPNEYENQRLKRIVVNYVLKNEITLDTSICNYVHNMDDAKNLELSEIDEGIIKPALIKIQNWMSSNLFSWGSLKDRIGGKTENTYYCQLKLYHTLRDISKEEDEWSTLEEIAKRIYEQGLLHTVKATSSVR